MKTIDFRPDRPATITLVGFYEQQPSRVLEAVRAGFERHFDAASAGQTEYPSTDWLSERIRVISCILDTRLADAESQHKRFQS